MLVLLLAALATPPDLVPLTEQGVHLAVPDGWKSWIDIDKHNATCALGLSTSLRLYWYDYKERLGLDRLLDITLQTTRDNVPIGTLVEIERRPAHDGAARALLAEYRLWRYRMNVVIVAFNDALHDRMVVAVTLADPDRFTEIDAPDLTARVVASLHTDDDPRREQLALNPPERRLYDEPLGSLLP